MADIGLGNPSAFNKTDPDTVAFTAATGSTIVTSQELWVTIAGILRRVPASTTVQMPALAAGTDYAIYLCNDGTVRASANFSAPSGFTTLTSRKIGGFHYAPGGNAAAQLGGDSTPAINPYSIWDLKFRPKCLDPRGMTLIGGKFWCDIYLTNTNVDVNGSSAYNVVIADGSSPPKKPAMFGGDGSAAYTTFMQFEAAEVLAAVGKGLLNYEEFSAAAFGTKEASSVTGAADPVNTILDADHTSKWGLIQATGNMWVWGADKNHYVSGADYATAIAFSYHNNTGGRGQIYSQGTYGISAAFFGGDWLSGSTSGSRASYWSHSPWYSSGAFGARGRCDHLRLV